MKKLKKMLKIIMTDKPEDTPEYESKIILETDSMGREKFWEDIGREND
jgi:hypothetical protein